jgi:TorA maturation chaperone TorD
METKDFLNHEWSRMEAFRLLSECYYLPNPGLSEILCNLERHTTNISQPVFQTVQRMRKEIESGQNFEALQVDFARLFVGPYKCPAAPYGSVYLEGGRTMMGDSTLDVKNRYLEEGLDIAKNFKDAPDHVTAELEFMYYLIFKEIEAFSNSDIETAGDFIQKQKYFLETHLMAWVPQFAGNIIEYAETLFYRNLAKATTTFLKENYKVVCAALDSGQLDSDKIVKINSIRM